jgi:hypothetical protein
MNANAGAAKAANGAAGAAISKVGNAAKKVGDAAKTAAVTVANNVPILFLLIAIGLAIWCLVIIVQKRGILATKNNVEITSQDREAIFNVKFASEFKDKKSLREAKADQDVSEREDCLINFQPLTVIHPGFVGPVRDGVYDEVDGITTLIRMGARCLVLPIDYHDKESMPSTFPPPNTPCLLYRDEGGTVRSINGGTIARVADTIANVAWSDIVTQRNDPFILILYFVRTPQENTREYLDFLSQVARDLAPLSPYLLGQTPEGVYNRQARQDQLLFVNTTQLEKKLLIFCNADTSGFRTSQTDFKHTYTPKEDLDYWVHMRIFKQNLDTPMGVTSIPVRSIMPRSIIDKTTYYTSLPSDATTQRKEIDGTKEKFMIILEKQGENPSNATLTKLLDQYGVQAVPLFLIDYTPEVQAALSKWKYAWRAKPKSIRYVRPEPIQVQAQNPNVNANGGMVNVPTA